MSICQRCSSSDSVTLPWGTFCISCLEKSKLCDGCETVQLTSDCLVVGNQILCRSCAGNALTCNKCGGLHIGGIKHRGRQYCNNCAADLVKCVVCGKVHIRKVNSREDALAFGIEEDTCASCISKIKATVTPKPILRCRVCGAIHTENTSKFEDTPCSSCLKNQITCVCCGKRRHVVYGRSYNNKMGVCGDCAKYKRAQWFYCNCCSCYHPKSNMADSGYCKECDAKIFKCPICRNHRDRNIDSVEIDGVLVCKRCSPLCICKTCGRMTIETDAGHCHSCCDTHKIVHVNNYSFKPRFKMFGNGIHLGVENEIANVSDADKIKLATVPRKWMFMKSDSSVEYGVECVFHPTTLTYFQENKTIIENHFKDCNIKPHKSAGMHVHMSKDKFGTYQLFKFIQFFKDHGEFITKIAERESGYAKPISEKATFFAKEAKNNGESDRYRAINICNRDTIEIRIFAGVTVPEKFFKNIEFCDALYNFTKTDVHFKKGHVDLSYFVAYVAANKHTYPNLNVFLGGSAKKEVPEKYREKDAEVVTPTTEAVIPRPAGTGLYNGCRVILTEMHPSYPHCDANPVVGSAHFCQGVIASYHVGECCDTRVHWDNGATNTYFNNSLTAI